MPDETDNKSDIKSDSPSLSNPKPKSSLKSKTTPDEKKTEEAVPKKVVGKRPKQEALPEIPDYDHPELEKYEPSDFDPTKYVKEELSFPERERVEDEKSPAKPKDTNLKAKPDDLPVVKDLDKPEVGKYKRAEKEPPKEPEDSKKLKIKAVGKPDEKKDDEAGKKLKSKNPKTENNEEPVVKPKVPKSKYEELPPIEEYEKPALEKYEKSDFEPTKKDPGASKKPAEKVSDNPKADTDKNPKKKVEEPAVDKTLSLKPKDKVKGKSVTEESTDVTITPKSNGKPKPQDESAEGKFPSKSQKPPTIAEESTSKDIVIKEKESPWAREDMPIEIKITEPDDSDRKNSGDDGSRKSVSFDKNANDEPSEKKKVRRTRQDASAPDDDVVMKDPEVSPIPNPEPPKPRPKYDPLRYVPDKDDIPSEDTEVNIIITNIHLHKHKTM